MNEFLTWLDMGGYAAYIWSAYAVVLAVLGFNILLMKGQKKGIRRKLKAWFKS